MVWPLTPSYYLAFQPGADTGHVKRVSGTKCAMQVACSKSKCYGNFESKSSASQTLWVSKMFVAGTKVYITVPSWDKMRVACSKSKCCGNCGFRPASESKSIISQTIEPLDLCLWLQPRYIVGSKTALVVCHPLHCNCTEILNWTVMHSDCLRLHIPKALIWTKLNGFGSQLSSPHLGLDRW